MFAFFFAFLTFIGILISGLAAIATLASLFAKTAKVKRLIQLKKKEERQKLLDELLKKKLVELEMGEMEDPEEIIEEPSSGLEEQTLQNNVCEIENGTGEINDNVCKVVQCDDNYVESNSGEYCLLENPNVG